MKKFVPLFLLLALTFSFSIEKGVFWGNSSIFIPANVALKDAVNIFTEDQTISGNISVNGYVSSQCQTLKMHRITELAVPTVDAWTNCDTFTIITDETIGDIITANVNTGAVTISKTGLYKFGGCVHFQNDSGGDKTPLVASRIFINGTSEAKCSQRDWNGTIKDGGQGALSYNGTVYLTSGDYINLQYYVNDSTIDFISDSVFASPVAWTIWLTYCGTN